MGKFGDLKEKYTAPPDWQMQKVKHAEAMVSILAEINQNIRDIKRILQHRRYYK